MKSFNLQVVTPDGVIFDGQATSLTVRADDGELQILAGHVDYIASVGIGRAKFETEQGERVAACSGGFVTVTGGVVRLVATTFEFKEDIDRDRAVVAMEKAKIKIRTAKSDRELELAEARLRRALNRINVANG